ncbi:xanthine dehydrogenase family protein molybdopterin-binding subunit [Sinorhizobium fredii]|uniref:xanthine dehydrogenase family protein molybdopterin-binding subunit n=1 Tax=Rhizobium fredii TaxID=380 RepID=UPI0004B13D7A|nr:molybdopterin cofactor-binding domain-containing protein [Sinorhizobium fredii]AWM28726.1 Isoquinoline 1-oxidoreductase beta subunit [Sinorhizobium fredii CCBAU 25509]
MTALDQWELPRRSLLKGGGALVLYFAISPARLAAQEAAPTPPPPPELPGSLSEFPFLDAWIRIDSDEAITVFTGKAELGQGIRTALIQVAAEQLKVDFSRIKLLTADTAQTPNEGYTAASHSMEKSGTAILHAAAYLRRMMIGFAAEELGIASDDLKVEDGIVVSSAGERRSYGQLVSGRSLHVTVEDQTGAFAPDDYTVMGQSVPRVDIPGKLTGEPSYVHDLRLEGMAHGRIVRPPRRGARLANLDTSAVDQMPGVLQVVRDGNYLGVIAEGEFQAIKAMQALQAAAQWEGGASLPSDTDIYDHLMHLPADSSVINGPQAPQSPPEGAKTIEATYTRPYQMHGSIGPSCAVGLFQDGHLTIWSHTQGVYPDRAAIAEMMAMDERSVHLIHMEGAGCYGHNGADDAAADAALLARAVPGRPVRIQWMRDHEHQWEPYGSAMVVRTSGSVSGTGDISSWNYEVWSNPHTTRPGPAGNLLPAQLISGAFRPEAPTNIPPPAGGADRNAVPEYRIPNARVVEHFIAEMPLRTSALRSLGAYMNVFALESFMDELALAAGKDPVEFRLARLEDPRARDVVTTVADAFDWTGWARGPGRGRGFAYARYKNLAAYCAVAIDLDVDVTTGRIKLGRAVAACDSGQAVNPDGIGNQIEGGLVQSASWTLFEQVRFNAHGVQSVDWAGYPIMRFPSVPATVEVHVIDRPGEPFLGTGEASQSPAAAAIANAVADATGVRIRDLPLLPQRVRTATRA